MNILYLDLNDNNLIEDYSENPNKYGGGRIFAAAARQIDKNFYIAANKKSFENIQDKVNCIETSEDQRSRITKGERLKDIIPNLERFDLFVYHRHDTYLNLDGLKGKQCCWAVGRDERINQKIENLLAHNQQYQNCIIGNNTKIYDIIIGTKNEGYKEYSKKDYIFQCSRHEPIFGTIQVAMLCKKHNIPAVFAGKIQDGYPLLDLVDGNLIKYVGLLSETEKVSYYKEALASTYLHFWQTPFNLSAVESLSYNTPIIATANGFWPSFVKEGVNGFIIKDEEEFLNAIKKCKQINQLNCYETSLGYTTEKMIKSFYEVFNYIINK
jgi:glycosyltransferase involved in cell wall biosynthesis